MRRVRTYATQRIDIYPTTSTHTHTQWHHFAFIGRIIIIDDKCPSYPCHVEEDDEPPPLLATAAKAAAAAAATEGQGCKLILFQVRGIRGPHDHHNIPPTTYTLCGKTFNELCVQSPLLGG